MPPSCTEHQWSQISRAISRQSPPNSNLLPFLQIVVPSGFSVHVLEEGMLVLVVFGSSLVFFPLETREQKSLYEVGGGWRSEILCEAGEMYDLSLVMS